MTASNLSSAAVESALRAHDSAWLASILETGYPVNSRLSGAPLLHRAAKTGFLEGCRILLAAGADTYLCDAEQDYALHKAVEGGFANVASLLIEAGADVDLKNVSGNTALHAAADRGLVDVCRVLLAAGCDASLPGGEGATALHLAARSGSAELCSLLIDAAVDVDATDHDSMTPLHHAASRGRQAACRVLLAAGADFRTLNSKEWQPIHEAATYGSPEVCQALISAGARADVSDGSGATPLWHACESDSVGVVELLLQHDADIGSVSGRREPALRFARSFDVAGRLLRAGANMHEALEEEAVDTVLQKLIELGRSGPVRACLEHEDVDLAQLTGAGKTLLQLATKHPEVKALLLAAKSECLVSGAIEGGVAVDEGGESRPRRSNGPSVL